MILLEAIPLGASFFYNAVVSGRVLGAQYKRIASTINLSKGLILDLGTGPGDLVIEIASTNRALDVLGIDVSAAMIKLARRKASQVPNARFRVMNAMRLLLSDESVDLVVSTASMHHWREPQRVFEEIHRVLKPGGRVLIYDLRSDAPRQEIFAEIPRALSLPPKLAVLWVSRLHGFTRKSLDAKIIPMIRSTSFCKGRIDTLGMWYRLSLLKKKPSSE